MNLEKFLQLDPAASGDRLLELALHWVASYQTDNVDKRWEIAAKLQEISEHLWRSQRTEMAQKFDAALQQWEPPRMECRELEDEEEDVIALEEQDDLDLFAAPPAAEAAAPSEPAEPGEEVQEDSGINLAAASDSDIPLDDEPAEVAGSTVESPGTADDDSPFDLFGEQDEDAESDAATQLSADDDFLLSPMEDSGGEAFDSDLAFDDENETSGSQVRNLDSETYDESADAMLGADDSAFRAHDDGASAARAPFASAPAAMMSPEASTARSRRKAAREETAPETSWQHPAARCYSVMNPNRQYRFEVNLGRKPQGTGRVGAKTQVTGEKFQLAKEEKVEVELVMPGCWVYAIPGPPVQGNRVLLSGSGDQSAAFCVIPFTTGKLEHCQVLFSREGQVVSRIELDVHVVTPALTYACGLLGFAVPVVRDDLNGLLEYFGLREMLPVWWPVGATILFLMAGLLYYLVWVRPRQKVMQQLTGMEPEEQLKMARWAASQGDSHRWAKLINGLLQTHPEFQPVWLYCGRFWYSQGQHQQALTHFRRGLELGPADREDYEQALRSARQSGDSAAEQAIRSLAAQHLSRGAQQQMAAAVG